MTYSFEEMKGQISEVGSGTLKLDWSAEYFLDAILYALSLAPEIIDHEGLTKQRKLTRPLNSSCLFSGATTTANTNACTNDAGSFHT